MLDKDDRETKLAGEVERLKAELAEANDDRMRGLRIAYKRTPDCQTVEEAAAALVAIIEKAEAELADARQDLADIVANDQGKEAEIARLEAELAAVNERVEKLAALLAEWIPQHSASCCMSDPGSGTFPAGPLKPNWCRCSSLEKRSREALRPAAPPKAKP